MLVVFRTVLRQAVTARRCAHTELGEDSRAFIGVRRLRIGKRRHCSDSAGSTADDSANYSVAYAFADLSVSACGCLSLPDRAPFETHGIAPVERNAGHQLH